MNSQLATFKHKNASKTGFSLLIFLFLEILWWYLLSRYQPGLCFMSFGVSSVPSPGSRSLLGWMWDGWEGPTVHVCSAASGKMDSAYTNDVILAKFRPEGITIFFWFSLTCIFKLAIVRILAHVCPVLWMVWGLVLGQGHRNLFIQLTGSWVHRDLERSVIETWNMEPRRGNSQSV